MYSSTILIEQVLQWTQFWALITNSFLRVSLFSTNSYTLAGQNLSDESTFQTGVFTPTLFPTPGVLRLDPEVGRLIVVVVGPTPGYTVQNVKGQDAVVLGIFYSGVD